MPGFSHKNPSLSRAAVEWWQTRVSETGLLSTAGEFFRELWDFLLECTPERHRRRYGDVEFDWEHRVDTTSATVSFRDRLLGVFHSAYQPTEPGPFHETLGQLPIDYREFSFIDLGCGKGRTLLMASDYPFRKIVGVELLPTLYRTALQNLEKYSAERQQASPIELVCDDARNFSFPAEPLVLYLFHPFSESVLKQVIANLARSFQECPRLIYVIYYNPVLEHVLEAWQFFKRLSRSEHCAVYLAAG